MVRELPGVTEPGLNRLLEKSDYYFCASGATNALKCIRLSAKLGVTHMAAAFTCPPSPTRHLAFSQWLRETEGSAITSTVQVKKRQGREARGPPAATLRGRPAFERRCPIPRPSCVDPA